MTHPPGRRASPAAAETPDPTTLAARSGAVSVLFRGRTREDAAPPFGSFAANRQVHSATVLEADPELLREADGLVTSEPDLPLRVVTADCLPVLLGDATRRRVAALHAGWRGLAAGVLPRGVARLGGDPAGAVAWIGPHIRPCCYEVSWPVALRVARVGGPHALRPGAAERPHLDLGAAARHQLERAGVADIRLSSLCTRCSPSWWSYRGDGPGAGRNEAFVWWSSQDPAAAPS